MVTTKQQLVSSRSSAYSGKNGRKYITIHETANTKKGADAQAHANLQSRGFTSSWHWTVDDKQAIQSFTHDVQCWHAGDARGNGNLNSIGVEICVNSDGDFNKAVENAAKLVRKIMQDENISVMNVVQHNRWSNKNCPANLRSGKKGVTWDDFISMLKGDKVHTPEQSKVKTSTVKQDQTLLRMGSKGQAVKELQQKLIAKGYKLPRFDADGHFGAETLQAVTAFQRDNSLSVDGIVGKQTMTALNAKPKAKQYVPYPNKLFRVGSRGKDVERIQRAINNAVGRNLLVVDGIFGKQTEREVRNYQRRHKLVVDGVVGAQTWSVMFGSIH